ncbi:MAG: hypothetical protein QM758_11930 [Armatimonas sp.]
MNFWHAIPLHYLPTLLYTGQLFSATALNRELSYITPRPTAIDRKRRLGLENYVHLSLKPITPLLSHKHGKGYPHALLRFPETLAERNNTGLLRFNTKRWTHRKDFVPVYDAVGKKEFLEAWRIGSYPSAELLVPNSLSLAEAEVIFLPDARYQRFFPGAELAAELFPTLATCPYETELESYLLLCLHLEKPLAPPELPFD